MAAWSLVHDPGCLFRHSTLYCAQVCQTTIVSVQWVPSCPGLLLVLDVHQSLYLCNLRSRSLSAVSKFKLAAASSQPLLQVSLLALLVDQGCPSTNIHSLTGLQVSSGPVQCSFTLSLGGASIACHAFASSLLQSHNTNEKGVDNAVLGGWSCSV